VDEDGQGIVNGFDDVRKKETYTKQVLRKV